MGIPKEEKGKGQVYLKKKIAKTSQTRVEK